MSAVVKLGGAVLADADAVAAVWAGVRSMGARAVVVHGGGPQQTDLARRLGHEPRVVAGRRVTGDLDLDVALWTLRGALNARLVGAGIAAGLRAVGISGADGGLVTVRRRPPREIDGALVDFGHVGDVDGVDPALVEALWAAGFTPVVASVCADGAGALYNVNADTVAAALAGALGASLDLVTEAGGVRRHAADPSSTLRQLSGAEADRGVREGWIAGGMRPKLETARAALDGGASRVRVCGPGDLGDPEAGTTVV